MRQLHVDQYTSPSAKKMAQVIEKWNDRVSMATLLYLAREEVAPIYELEDLFIKYISTEEEIMEKTQTLKEIGLLEIYEGQMFTNGTTIVRLTPFGIEVSRYLEAEEIKKGYPTTKEILLSVLQKRLQSMDPSPPMIDVAINSDLLSSKEENPEISSVIEFLQKYDRISSWLITKYQSLT